MVYCRESQKYRGLKSVFNRWSVCGLSFSVPGNRHGVRKHRVDKKDTKVNCMKCLTMEEASDVALFEVDEDEEP